VEWWHDLKFPPTPSRSDYISFKVKNKSGKVVVDTPRAACFYSGNKYLNSHRFEVREGGQWRKLAGEKVHRFMDLCKYSQLMPPNASIEIEDGKPVIDVKGPGHQMYAGLTMFRYMVTCKEIVDLILQCMDRSPHVTFYQAYHLAMLKYTFNTNHSFTEQIHAGHIDLAHSVALARFFYHAADDPNSPCRQEKYKQEPPSKLTSKCLNVYAKDVGLVIGKSVYGGAAIGGMPLTNPTDVLWDEFAPLYDPEMTPTENLIPVFLETKKSLGLK
jgi:hypothetical protein